MESRTASFQGDSGSRHRARTSSEFRRRTSRGGLLLHPSEEGNGTDTTDDQGRGHRNMRNRAARAAMMRTSQSFPNLCGDTVTDSEAESEDL